MQNAGRKLVLTRPEAASQRFLEAFEAEAGPVAAVISPVLEIVDLPVERVSALPAALVLTSENGARAIARAGLPAGITAWCVGARTAQIARQMGAQAIEAGPDAARMVPRLLAEAGPGPFLHLRGEHAAAEIAQILRQAGRACCEQIVYRQEIRALNPEARSALREAGDVLLPLFSPRSAAAVAAQGPFGARLTVLAISNATAQAAQGLGAAEVHVADEPEGAAMLRRSLALWSKGV